MKSKEEKIFNVINNILMGLFCLIILYPVWYITIIAFNNGPDAAMGGIYLIPRVFTMDNFKTVFQTDGIIKAFGVTALRVVIGVTTHVLFTAMVAYGLSKPKLRGRKIFINMGIVTMFFSGGLIPYYLLMKDLGFLDSFWMYIIPSMFNFFDLIIFQSFFKELPASLEESAHIDGANDLQIFVKIILPLSMPVIATIALFNGVYHWNDYMTGLIFINNDSLQTIQTYLYKIIAQSQASSMAAQAGAAGVARTVTTKSIQLATMVVTTLPIMCVYPFLQKYFVKGVMVGSVKG